MWALTDLTGGISIRLKETTTICKKWVKSRVLIFGDYLSSKVRWTNRFSLVGRTAFELLIFEEFNHDSCSWRHQIKLISGRPKTFYRPQLRNDPFYDFFKTILRNIHSKRMLLLLRTFKKSIRCSGNDQTFKIALQTIRRKWKWESDKLSSRLNLYIIKNVVISFLFCLSYQ